MVVYDAYAAWEYIWKNIIENDTDLGLEPRSWTLQSDTCTTEAFQRVYYISNK